MKRITFSILTILAVALTACGSLATGTSTSSKQASTSAPTELQLAVGILKLEGTENAVTTEQASGLLMLWQVYQDLSQSDTAAQEEVSAIFEQVQETLTSKQIQAITDMQISQKDVASVMQGVTFTTTSSSSNSSSANVSSGGGPQGGGVPPDMGGIPGDLGGGSTTSTNQSQSTPAASSVGGSAGVPSALVELIIQSLQQKISSY
jgi:hypothetical protein